MRKEKSIIAFLGRYLYGVALLAILAVIGFGFWYDGLSAPSQFGDVELGSLRAELFATMENMSAPEAYSAFKQKAARMADTRQHSAAHIFGEVLYRKEGLDGVSVCDSSFGFGCYHSFFGIAIAEHGPQVSLDLDEGCFKAYGRLGTGCPHGIGHGLMWYFGDEKLTPALENCDGMHYQGAIGGCSDGVFMEYNEHTMATGEDVIGRRPYVEARRHEPCLSVEVRYKEACYYRQGDWWFRSLGGNVKKVGTYCAEAATPVEQVACYRGLGYTIATESAYLPDRSVSSCDLLDSIAARNRCLEGAAWASISNPEHTALAPTICAAAEDAGACMEAAVLIR